MQKAGYHGRREEKIHEKRTTRSSEGLQRRQKESHTGCQCFARPASRVRRVLKLPHLFHALLLAELADNAGWDLLHSLAGELGDSAAKKEFGKRLREEAEHLLFVRKVVQKFALSETTGQPQKMPKSSGVVETLLK